jgi:hypothetical protein
MIGNLSTPRGSANMIGIRLKTLIPALVLTVLAGPAFADAIDGNWCHSDGRRFTIRGPEIVTPGGKHMEGNYSRHSFAYTAPAPEPGAGQNILMTLANENTVRRRSARSDCCRGLESAATR